jgi:hypothetical protein
MSVIFKNGDLVQSIHGGPVMRVVAVRSGATGQIVVDTLLVHGGTDEPAHYSPADLKVIGDDPDDDEEFDDDGE